MRKLFILLGFISALTAVILAVNPLYNLAVTPIILAFVSGLVVIFLSKKENIKTKAIQYIFLLVIIALSITIYKGVVYPSNAIDVQKIEQQGDENPKGSKINPAWIHQQ